MFVILLSGLSCRGMLLLGTKIICHWRHICFETQCVTFKVQKQLWHCSITRYFTLKNLSYVSSCWDLTLSLSALEVFRHSDKWNDLWPGPCFLHNVLNFRNMTSTINLKGLNFLAVPSNTKDSPQIIITSGHSLLLISMCTGWHAAIASVGKLHIPVKVNHLRKARWQ